MFSMKGKAIKFFIPAVLAGFLGSLLPGPVLGITISAGLLFYLYRTSSDLGRRTPFWIFLTGFSIRFAMIVLICLFSIINGNDLVLSGDGFNNLHFSKYAISVFHGYLDYLNTSLEPGYYGYSLLIWIHGAIYFLIGYSPFLVLILNAIASSLAAWMIYLLTYRITGHRLIATWALGFTILSPSQILWSADFLKEPSIELILAVIIYLFVVMIQQKRWHYLIILALLTYPLGQLRVNLHYLVLAALGLSAVLLIPRRLITGILFLIVILTALVFHRKPSRIIDEYRNFQVEIIAIQMGNITTGGTYYKFIPDRYQPGASNNSPMTLSEMALSYLKALYYYLCSPNPFQDVTLNKIPALPQMFLWYFLLIFFFPVGTLYLLRYHFRSSGIIFIYLLVLTSGLAFFTGNEGTAFRQRDILTPFFFIPIAVGMINTLGWLARRAGPPAPSSANEPSKQEN
jgi:hypothetical protein